MKFGSVKVADAEGAILAHSVRHGAGVFKKGVRLDAAAIESLQAAGIADVICARLEADDVHEDSAAERLASAVASGLVRTDPAFTGRANLFAEEAGVLRVDQAAIDRFNRIDEAITLATLPDLKAVVPGEMVATVKIIPFAAPEASVAAAEAIAVASDLTRIAPYRPKRIGVVATTLPVLKPSVLDKTRRILDGRLEGTGSTVVDEKRVPHDSAAIAGAIGDLKDAGADLILVYGASAIVDRADMVPAGIEAAGGRITHFGMPVDPGNLMLMAELGPVPVIGAPGCARSPKENGFDWVLQRLLADIPVTPETIQAMGVGGLLMEIVSRPQPRAERPEATESRPRIGIVLLAAGRSRRMGGPNKLLETVAAAPFNGRPLIRRAAEQAVASAADAVVVVTGHQADAVRSVLSDLPLRFADNPNFADGLSTSLAAGLDALPADIDAALICLGDMPRITADVMTRLIETYRNDQDARIVVSTVDGKRGNPVLWSRAFFADLKAVRGDVGGRALIGDHSAAVVEVEVGADAGFDVDTPEVLAKLRAHG